MVEVLFRTRSVPHANPKIHVQRYHRGDVIVWRLDGWNWSAADLQHPAWRIVRAPITTTEAAFLTGAEDNTFENKTRTWARQRKLDLDNLGLPDRFAKWLRDDTRVIGILDVDASLLRNYYTDKGLAMDLT